MKELILSTMKKVEKEHYISKNLFRWKLHKKRHENRHYTIVEKCYRKVQNFFSGFLLSLQNISLASVES